MTRQLKRRWILGSALALLALLVTPEVPGRAAVGPGLNPRTVAFAPGSRPYGKSCEQWAHEWWAWVFRLHSENHPLFDENGEFAGEGQPELGPRNHVFFLVGVWNKSNTAVRRITIPRGTSLFFPILNVVAENSTPFDPETEKRLGINAPYD